MQTRSKKIFNSLIAFTLIGSVATYGQDNTESDVFELSPFEVSGANDTGYRATNTLAGTRTSTELKNVAAAVSVVTEEFISDAAMTNINDLFAFMPSAEGTATFTDGGGETNGWAAASNSGLSLAGVSRGALSELGMDRVRGLENATVARDYFETSIPLDTYNVTRAALNRGPNSILFGLGKSSGTLNYTLKKAIIGDNSNSVTVRVGNEHLFRSTFDVNRTLISGENGTGLAVRINGLFKENGARFTPPSSATDRRLYGAITWKPTEKTSVYANLEKSNRRTSPSTNIGVRDGITEWFNAGSPTYDPSVSGPFPAGLKKAVLRDGIQGFFDTDTWESGDPDYALQVIAGSTDDLMLANGNQFQLAQPLWVRDSVHMSDLSSNDATFRPEVLLDQLKNMSNDPSSRYNYDDEAYNITLQHNFFNSLQFLGGRNSFNAQLQIFREDVQFNDRSAFHEGHDIRVDVNTTRPTGNLNPDGTMQFEPNPNLYRPWTMARHQWNSTYYSKREADQLELTWDWQGEGNWVNKLALTAMVKESSRDQDPIMTNKIMRDRPAEMLSSTRVHEGYGSAGSGGPILSSVLYLGPALNPSDPFGSLQITPQPTTRGEYNWTNVVFYDNDEKRFRNYTGGVNAMDGVLEYGNRFQDDVETQAAVFSGMFLENKLSLIYGIREDEITAFSQGPSQRSRTNGDYLPESKNFVNPGNVNSGTTSSMGAVYHVADWLSLHYNEADNFVPEGLRTDVFGFEIPAPTGEGVDKGFTLNLLENKLTVKVNRYETIQVNQSDNGISRSNDLGLLNWESLWLWEDLVAKGRPNEFQYVNDSGEMFGPYGAAPLELGNLQRGADPTYAEVTSFVAKGTEIEIFFSPTPNWQIVGNVSETETVQGQIGRRTVQWMEFREPYYRTLSNWNELGVERWTSQTPAENWQNMKNGIAKAQLNEGFPASQLRKYAANLNTSYTFNDGKFSGVGIGGGLRWADKAVIGHGVVAGPDGADILDRNQPYYGDYIFDLNLFAKYRTKIRGLDTQFQINANGLLQGSDVRAISKASDGFTTHYAYSNPTGVSFTTKINF